ncbi:hypothetical protein JCM15908A_06810 [Prevotella dentasini JCM 15908]
MAGSERDNVEDEETLKEQNPKEHRSPCPAARARLQDYSRWDETAAGPRQGVLSARQKG